MDDDITLKRCPFCGSYPIHEDIGGIAKKENKDEYTLDPIGDVNIRQSKVLFEIPCEW